MGPETDKGDNVPTFQEWFWKKKLISQSNNATDEGKYLTLKFAKN